MADTEVQWKSKRLKLIENTDGTYSIATAVGSGAPDQEVVGNVAHDAADSGNPVKVGGVYRLTPPVLSDGDRGDLSISTRGAAFVTPMAPSGNIQMDSNGAFTQGNVAHDAVDSGSPVKIGGKANSTYPTPVAAGDRVDAWMTVHGAMMLGGRQLSAMSDAIANVGGQVVTDTGNPSLLMVAPHVFNGTTWDRPRGDTTGAHVVPRATVVELTATPTIDTSIFASGDVLHSTIITFTGAVRSAGGTGTIIGFTVFDYDLEQAALELWLFSSSVTIPAANAAWSVSDADATNCIGVLPSSVYYASALNAVATSSPVHPFKAGAGTTSIYGALVTRGTPTYTNATDLKVALRIVQD